MVRRPGFAKRLGEPRGWNGVAVGGFIGVVALLARLLPVLRGAGLGGLLSYDDGVYFGAAESFVFGRLPYRDFVLLHPPGIVWSLAPFAELARWTRDDALGLEAGRLAFMCVGAACAVLVYLIGRRISPVAGVVGGLFYALWEPSTYAERSTLLEPLVNAGVLLALFALSDLRTTSRRRIILAGVALGLAASVKIWAVVPVVVLGIWLLVRAGPRRCLTFVGTSIAAAMLVCGPFLVVAPDRMFHFVVLDQLGRSSNGVTLARRLVSITDVRLSRDPVTTLTVAAALLVLVVLATIATWIYVTDSRTRPWVSLLAAQLAVLLVSPLYYPHYADFVAPTIALIVGAAASRAFGWVHAYAPRLEPVAALVVLAALAMAGMSSQLHGEGHHGPGAPVRLALSDARCVTGDSLSTLIAVNMLSRDLRNACPLIVDVTGLSYTQDRGDMEEGNTDRARIHDPEWQHQVTRYFLRSNAVILKRHNPVGLDEQTLARLRRDGPMLQAESYDIYRPGGSAPPD